MLKKILPYIEICLLALMTNQCFTKCNVSPIQDTTNLILQWQEESKQLEIAGLDLTKTQEGKVCYVPSEDATYFINLRGNAWKFTRNAAGGLEAQGIGKLPQSFGPGEMFVFTAGTKEQQSLFVGKINSVKNRLQIWQRGFSNWKEVLDTSITNLNYLLTSTILSSTPSVSLELQQRNGVSACTWEYNQEICGCILVPVQQLTYSGYGQFSSHTVVLVFDPNTNKIKPLESTLPRNSRQYPIEAISPAPNKLIFGYGNNISSSSEFFLLSIANEKVDIVPNKKIDNKGCNVQGSFKLQLNGEVAIEDPIFYDVFDSTYHFYRLHSDNTFVSAGDPAISLDQNTLILPFANELYCLTTEDTEEGKKQQVYYQARLQLNSQKSSK